MLRVIHRSDHLIEKNAADGHADHAAILQFLEERLINRTFEDRDALVSVMNEWPAFAAGDSRLKEHGSSTMRRMVFSDHNTIALSPGSHWPMDIAIIEEV